MRKSTLRKHLDSKNSRWISDKEKLEIKEGLEDIALGRVRSLRDVAKKFNIKL